MTDTANDEVDAIIGRVRYDLTGDQMRAMRECDDANLRDELRRLIRNRDEQHAKCQEQFATICQMDTQRDQLRAEIAALKKALQDVEKTGSALALLLHPEFGFEMPPRGEIVSAIQGMNRACALAITADRR